MFSSKRYLRSVDNVQLISGSQTNLLYGVKVILDLFLEAFARNMIIKDIRGGVISDNESVVPVFDIFCRDLGGAFVGAGADLARVAVKFGFVAHKNLRMAAYLQE